MSRRLQLGGPSNSFDPESWKRWVENSLRQIERASHEPEIVYDSRDTVTEITLNGSTLPDHGLVNIRTTGGTGHILPPPRLGYWLTLVAFSASTNDVTITASTNVSVMKSSTSGNQLIFQEPDAVMLRGASDTEWVVVPGNGTVSIATTS